MPFLIPAIVALVADAVLLVLSRHRSHLRAQREAHGETDTWIYASTYLSSLAAIRLCLLLVPLLFHSYTGTALRWPPVYHALYWGSLLWVTLQVMGLALLNPESMEALLPIDPATSSDSVLHDLRRLWYMLLLTLLSNVCHLVLLVHVRSTAPSDRQPDEWFHRGARQKAPSLYFQLRRYSSAATRSGRALPLPTSTHNENDDFLHTMSDFMEDLQIRLRKAKSEWSARLEDFSSRISASSQLAGQGMLNGSSSLHHAHQQPHQRSTIVAHHPLTPMTAMTPFRVLLQLFAYQNVLENGKLDQVFDMDDGVSLTYWVPQLLSFLLHGALETSPMLEEWILEKCKRNIHFAHRCYWFLRAWCLEAPLAPQPSQPTRALAPASRNGSDSQLAASSSSGLVPFLDEPAVHQGASTNLCNPKRAMRTMTSTPLGKILPEERALIERLMLRVKECGEVAARALEFGPDEESSKDGPRVAPSCGDDADSTSSDLSFVSCQPNAVSPLGNRKKRETEEALDVAHVGWHGAPNGKDDQFYSPSILMNAVEKGLVPIHPLTGFPSVRHLDVMSSYHKFGFLPSPEGESKVIQNNEHGSRETEQFDKALRFLDTLLFLAERLFEVPANDRKSELQKQLQIIECELLPDNAVYMPIGKSNHRVWRIVSEESIPLGTKERVPCIVTLEVVSSQMTRGATMGWSIPPNSTQSHAATTGISGRDHDSSPSSRRALDLSEHDSVESELIAEWRFGRREPFRRTAFFDKVTDTVKGATDKMSAQMRHKISLFRDRSSSEEMKSLKALDTVAALGSATIREPDRYHTTCDLEASIDSEVKGRGSESAEDLAIPSSNSCASLASMGQWSSPQGKTKPPDQTAKSHSPIKLLGDNSESSVLRYGSDHDGEPSLKSPAHPDTETSDDARHEMTTQHRPPVVFRESWEAKEKRIRSKSALGKEPGWRLLPVLVKANDDLRQEQLASQLIYRMAAILAREKVNVWLCPYEIIALTNSGGIIEAIPDTISIDSLKRNDASFSSLKNFFITHFGIEGGEEFAGAQANFVESLAAYSIVCYLLQIKDRHNGNILVDNRGHIIHIDFGFFFLSSPGSNAGFENAPFKLTRDFVDLLGGPQSRLFRTFRELCYKTFITLRRHCMEIILTVEMLKEGNEELSCFRGRPDEAIRQLRERFRLDLNDRACRELVNCLIDDSVENWRTDWYDRYQRYFVGVL